MGNRKSKHKTKSSSSPKEKNNNDNQGKIYMNDPVFGRMVYNEIVGAWVPAANENMYEESMKEYIKEKENNKKYLKTFNINPEKINNFYEEMPTNISIIKIIPIKLEIYNYIYFLNDGRLAANWSNQLNIYSKDFETIEQKINVESIHITQLKDNSLIISHYNTADVYKYNKEEKTFNFDYSLKCINSGKKVVELSNERLAFLKDDITIYLKENGKYVEDGNKNLSITTIDDFIEINENEIASISAQESVITFWDLTTREINAQIDDIENFGHSCLILFNKSLIVGGANRNFCENPISYRYIYIINVDNKELIKKYSFPRNIWFMIKINEKEFVTGETKGIINKYRFEDNELKLMEINKDNKEQIVKKLAFCRNSNQLASMNETELIIFKVSE